MLSQAGKGQGRRDLHALQNNWTSMWLWATLTEYKEKSFKNLENISKMSLDLNPFDLGKRKAKAQQSRLTLRMLFPADINAFGGRRGKTWVFI